MTRQRSTRFSPRLPIHAGTCSIAPVAARFRRWLGSPLALGAAILLILGAAGVALASSGVGSLVAGGEDGAVSARGAQAPLGAVSAATANSGPKSDVEAEVFSSRANPTGGQGAGPTSGSGAQVPTPAGGGSLPFTGFLAIGVLLGGVALLGTGLLLRRRRPA